MLQTIQKCSNWIVLREFLEDPQKKFFIRELSRKIDLAPTSVTLHLNTLVKQGLVKKSDDFYTRYSANFDNEEFRFYKKINTQLKLKELGLTEFLEEEFSPDAIILFGSAAKGEDLVNSDLDICLLSTPKKVDLIKYEKELNRKIQLFVKQDIGKFPKELRNNILNGTKLYGYVVIWN